MKGRAPATSAGTTQRQVIEKLERGARRPRQKWFNARVPLFQSHHQSARLVIAVAALAIVVLLGVLLVSYGLRLYQNWHENGLLDRATALLQQGKLGTAAQTAQELLARHPDSLPALSILADTAETQNLEEAVSWRERIARLRPKDPES